MTSRVHAPTAGARTGWTGLIAPILDFFGRVDAKAALEVERDHLSAQLVDEQVGGEQSLT
jgi:hypothetical protein